jgi:hypothetical protein
MMQRAMNGYAVSAYYDGRAFVPTIPVQVKKNQMAIITIMDFPKAVDNEYETAQLDFYDTAQPEDPPEVWKARNESLLALVGTIPHKDIVEMENSIAECREIDPNEW